MSKEFKNTDELFQSAFADESADVPAIIKRNIDLRLKKDKNRKAFYLGLLFVIGPGTALLIYMAGDGAVKPGTVTGLSSLSGQHSARGYTSPLLREPVAEINNPNGALYNSADNPQNHASSSTLQGQNSGNPISQPASGSNQSSADDNGADNASGMPSLSADPAVPVSPVVTGNTTTGNPATGDPGRDEQPGNTSADGPSDLSSDLGVSPKKTDKNSQTGEVPPADTTAAETVTAGNPEAVLPTVFIDREEKYNPWMIGVNGGVNPGRSAYKAPTQAEADLYTQGTNDVPGTSFNADVKYRMNNSLTFGSGIGLTQFVENYYFYKSLTNINTTTTWDYLYDSIDTTNLIPIDSIATYHTDTITNVLYDETGATRATYLHVPLSIGTQIIRNKFRFDLFVAARFNYLVAARGGYIANDNFVSFGQNNSIFKTWYVDVLMGGAVHYNLFSGLYISADCSFRPAVGNLYSGTTFNRSFRYTHLGVGLSWKF